MRFFSLTPDSYSLPGVLILLSDTPKVINESFMFLETTYYYDNVTQNSFWCRKN